MQKSPKNFAIWTALNSDCYFFSNAPSYYGGSSRTIEQQKRMEDFCKKNNIRSAYSRYDYCDSQILDVIMTIGIDWEKCSMPKSDSVAEFNGTEADSSWKEIVTGYLVLNNEDKIEYYAECQLNMHQFTAMQTFFELGE